MSKKYLTFLAAVYLLFAAASVTWVYHDALGSAASADRQAGSVRLAEAASRLRGQLDVFKAVVNLLAKDNKIRSALEEQSFATINSELSTIRLTYGLSKIDLVDLDGRQIASSTNTEVSYDNSSSLIRAARNGRLGYEINIDGTDRLIHFSRVVRNSDFSALGIVVVTANLSELEFQWPIIPEPVIFFNKDDLSVSANRFDLLHLSNNGEPRFPVSRRKFVAGAEFWTFSPSNEEPQEVQIMRAEIPLLELNSQILLDTKYARSVALLRAGLALALLTAFGLIAAIVVLQRRRIEAEARHSATLEQRVEDRTAELRAAQDRLVEASNLAALGRLSAGLSHEINQPLAAILNFAENGRQFIAKKKVGKASENLELIGNQIRRITRIINNLRAFARQEVSPTEEIDFVAAAKNAIELNKDRIKSSKIEISVDLPEGQVWVIAGQIRLEQVISNLIANAIDAMQDSNPRNLKISLGVKEGDAILSVADNGTGIEEPDRVFEPFYTTKELGASKGLGMGLALSFGITAQFGGQLTCRNLDQGSEFAVTLPTVLEPENV